MLHVVWVQKYVVRSWISLPPGSSWIPIVDKTSKTKIQSLYKLSPAYKITFSTTELRVSKIKQRTSTVIPLRNNVDLRLYPCDNEYVKLRRRSRLLPANNPNAIRRPSKLFTVYTIPFPDLLYLLLQLNFNDQPNVLGSSRGSQSQLRSRFRQHELYGEGK